MSARHWPVVVAVYLAVFAAMVRRADAAGSGQTPLDAAIVGTWCRVVSTPNGQDVAVWVIGADGHDQISYRGPLSKPDEPGLAQFANGAWNRRSSNGNADQGKYALIGSGTAAISGSDGKTILWLRTADSQPAVTAGTSSATPQASGANGTVDPALVGAWGSVGPANKVVTIWTISADGKYQMTYQGPTNASDGSGQVHFAGGKWDQQSDSGRGNHGEYVVRDRDTVAITGAAKRTTIWLRLADTTPTAATAQAPAPAAQPPVFVPAAAGGAVAEAPQSAGSAIGVGTQLPSGVPPELAAMLRAGAPPELVAKAMKDTASPAAAPGPSFVVPAAGPMVQTPPFAVDLSHEDLPGPDPRYTSWQGCSVGDYVISTLKNHTATADSTGEQLEYLSAVDPDGVLVLTIIQLNEITLHSPGSAAPDFTAMTGPVHGYFTYYSATAVNPADAGLIAGLQSVPDVPSPLIGGRLGTAKSFTYGIPNEKQTTLSVWANPNLPNLLAMSVHASSESLTVQTVVACHRSHGESWSEPHAYPNEKYLMQMADVASSVGLVSYSRIRDSWVIKYNPDLQQDRQVVQVKNLSIAGSVKESPPEEKPSHLTMHAALVWQTKTIRTLIKGQWTPWHNLASGPGFGDVAHLNYFLSDQGGWHVSPVQSLESTFFRPDGGYLPLDRYAATPAEFQAALMRPDAPLPAEAKRTGMEADHWGNLVAAQQSTSDEDRRLIAHLTATLPRPLGRLVQYARPGFGCTFQYDMKDEVVQMLEPHWVGLMMHSYVPPMQTDVEVAAQPIYAGNNPTLDGEYRRAIDWHNKETDVSASNPAKLKVAGLDAYAFTIDSRDLHNDEIRTAEIFAIGRTRTLRLTFTCTRDASERAWIQLRRIMDSVQLQD